jgi:hypothetical protein
MSEVLCRGLLEQEPDAGLGYGGLGRDVNGCL